MSEFEDVADEETLEGPSDEALATISEYARQQVEIEDEIAYLEALLARAKLRLQMVSVFKLPEAMKAAGCESFTLTGGAEIEVKPLVKASISDENKAAAFQWLREHNHDAIIKNQIISSFGKRQDNEAAELEQFLQEHEWDYDRKESIHGNTLNAFCKEEVQKGSDIPHDLFGIWVGAKAKITRPIS